MSIRVLAMMLLSAVLFAQNGPLPNLSPDVSNGIAENDPPSRAARLGLLNGKVSFQPGGVEDWVPATLNRPLTTGDRLWTDTGARAEVHLGSVVFRLNGRTNFTFLNLNDNLAQVQLSSGALNVRVRRLEDREAVEIDTPQAAFTITRNGEYRIDVSEQGEWSVATVRGGELEANAGNQSFRLRSREQLRVMEENGQPVFDRRDAPVADGFDNWCLDRDRREDRSESGRHVSREMPGYADLDDHGVWREEAEFGWVWAPRVQIGWAPYHEGHWAWIEPWGWTWVDDAPWGFAPFHYGRWAFAGAAWVWIPGPVAVRRPVYAPALVAWVGGVGIGGGGFGIGISAGVAPVGWFALGPREVWVPPYRHSPTYITQVNVTNTVIVNRTVINNVNVTNVNYVNRGVPGAVTAVPQDAMTSGRPVRQAALNLPPDVAMRAPVRRSLETAPQRGAVVGGAAPSNSAPPAAVSNRPVFTRNGPPPAPVPFEERRAAWQANPGQPLQPNQPPAQGALARPGFRPAVPSSDAPANQPQVNQPQVNQRQVNQPPVFVPPSERSGFPRTGEARRERESQNPPPAQTAPPLAPPIRRGPPVERPPAAQPPPAAPVERQAPPRNEPRTDQRNDQKQRREERREERRPEKQVN